jgi:hypothetical protein
MWTAGTGRSRAALVAGSVLLACGLLTARHPAVRHRFHAPSAGDRPAIIGPIAGAREVFTRHTPHVPVVADPLPPWLFYAVTPTEVAAALDDLPTPWRDTVGAVRLCFRRDGDVMAETDGESIELHYVVDGDGRAPVAQGETTEEEEQFGGIAERRDGQTWVRWPQRRLLQNYVLKHLLIHEVGHHLAPPNLSEDEDEDWAEAFAFRFYDPRQTDRRRASSERH